MFQTPASVHKIETMADKGLGIKLYTPELEPESMARIFAFKGLAVWCALQETKIKEEYLKIPEVIPEFKNEKSLSERLRNVMWLFHNKKYPKQNDNFEQWRKNQMEKIINQYKEKINE